MHRLKAWLAFVALVLGTLGSVGCSDVCDAYCDATVDKIVELGCWEVWESTWADQGYDDQDGYLTHCKDTFDATYKDARENSDSAAADVRQTCSDKLDETDAAEGCEDVAIAGY